MQVIQAHRRHGLLGSARAQLLAEIQREGLSPHRDFWCKM